MSRLLVWTLRFYLCAVLCGVALAVLVVLHGGTAAAVLGTLLSVWRTVVLYVASFLFWAFALATAVQLAILELPVEDRSASYEQLRHRISRRSVSRMIIVTAISLVIYLTPESISYFISPLLRAGEIGTMTAIRVCVASLIVSGMFLWSSEAACRMRAYEVA